MDMENPPLLTNIKDGYAQITINRPEQSNALSIELFRQLKVIVNELSDQDNVASIVIEGEGKHFSSGLDLADYQTIIQKLHNMTPGEAKQYLYDLVIELQGCLLSLVDSPKPIIAAIDGACVGGAVDLICACDIRLATAASIFSIKEVDLRIIADLGTLQHLPLLVGEGIAKELSLTGRNFGADEACRYGLLNNVYENEHSLNAGIESYTNLFTQKCPHTLAGIKQAFRQNKEHMFRNQFIEVAKLNVGHMLKLAQ